MMLAKIGLSTSVSQINGNASATTTPSPIAFHKHTALIPKYAPKNAKAIVGLTSALYVPTHPSFFSWALLAYSATISLLMLSTCACSNWYFAVCSASCACFSSIAISCLFAWRCSKKPKIFGKKLVPNPSKLPRMVSKLFNQFAYTSKNKKAGNPYAQNFACSGLALPPIF